MKIKPPVSILLFLLLLSYTTAFVGVFFVQEVFAQETVSVLPSTNVYEVGVEFTASIDVSYVEGVRSWELKLRFDSSILSTDKGMIDEGGFLKQGGGVATYFVEDVSSTTITLGCLIIANDWVDGGGTLATIRFRVVDNGKVDLDLYDTVFRDVGSVPIDPQPDPVDGVFYTQAPRASFYYLPSIRAAPDYTPDPSLRHDPSVGETITFNASAYTLGNFYRGSYDPDTATADDPDGSIVSYVWDFGDGNMTSVHSPIITHVYGSSWAYTVRLNVTDVDGVSGFFSLPVSVFNIGQYQYVTPDFSKAPSPTYFDTSEFMLGSVAVGIILPESAGGDYNWTDSEIFFTVEGIKAGMNWWKSQNPNAYLIFEYDIHTQVPTTYEPIQMPEWKDYIWIEEVMAQLNYTSGTAWERVQKYNNDIRQTLSTDWAFTIFVADSDPSVSQGTFASSGYAHAFLGGPWITMSRFSSWAWNSGSYYAAVPAHEMGHIFYATDEYNGVQENSGYFDATDKDGSVGIMNQNDFLVSASTKLQIGWRDTDQDDILDIMDTHPAVKLDNYPSPIIGSSYQFSGVAVEVPHRNFNPFGQRNNLSINKIISVEYSVDEGSWLPASPLDAFDGTLENFTLVVTFTTIGTHALRIRATNSVGNSKEWNFTVENVSPRPVAYFTFSPSVLITGEPTFFDGTGSYDPTGGTIVTYAWDFGDGTSASETDPFTSHTYSQTGNFTVRLTITNNIGQTDTTERLVTVMQRSIISVSVNPNPVVIGKSTTISGMLTPARIGAVVTIQWRRYSWENWMFLTSVLTDEKGGYAYMWTPQEVMSVEIRVSWSGDETTLPAENFTTLNVISPPPTIVIEPTSGPVGTKVLVKGYNFTGSMTLYLTFDDQLVGIIFVDRTGLFNATFNVPLSEIGPHTVKAVTYGYYMYEVRVAEATFTVIDVAPLDVNLDVGSIYFKRETVVFVVQTTFRGTAVNVTFLKATLLMPDGSTQILSAQQIGAGLYTISYVISGKGSMQGTYTATVEASYITETINANGSSIKTFVVKPTWEKEAPKIAAFSIASLGLVSAMILLWQKEKKKPL